MSNMRVVSTSRPTYVTDKCEVEITISLDEYRANLAAGFDFMDQLTSFLYRLPGMRDRYVVIRANGWSKTTVIGDRQTGTVHFRAMQRVVD